MCLDNIYVLKQSMKSLCCCSSAYKPEVKASFKEREISEDQTVMLPCEIDGKPSPTIYWKKNGQKMEGPKYKMNKTGNMTIVVRRLIIFVFLNYQFHELLLNYYCSTNVLTKYLHCCSDIWRKQHLFFFSFLFFKRDFFFILSLITCLRDSYRVLLNCHIKLGQHSKLPVQKCYLKDKGWKLKSS